MSPTFRTVLLLVGFSLFAGCGSQTDHFPPNALFARVAAYPHGLSPDRAAEDTAAVVEALFGTPDDPKVPAAIADGLIDPENLGRAAGPVSSDKRDIHFGLYRAHCVVCHGIDGGGAGPAAGLQNPYPRDFRAGIFKYKSTPRGDKPTRDDLRRLIVRGVPGTGMPNFSRLPEEDLEALVDYVVYLSIRGETERTVLRDAVDELGYGDDSAPVIDLARVADMLGSPESLEGTADDETVEYAQSILDRAAAVADGWRGASPTPIPAVADTATSMEAAWFDAVARGRELFHGPLANCASCHGKEGRGDVVTLDFDDWTKEYTTRLGIAPDDRERLAPMRRAGALTPRAARPRNLSWGVYRGGGDAETLYRRLTHGIDGTPMPGLLLADGTAGSVGVTPEQVRDLVAYLQSLASEHGHAMMAENTQPAASRLPPVTPLEDAGSQ